MCFACCQGYLTFENKFLLGLDRRSLHDRLMVSNLKGVSMKDFMAGAGIIATAFYAAYMIAASLDYITNGGIRKDILSVDEYVIQYENCKKHGMSLW